MPDTNKNKTTLGVFVKLWCRKCYRNVCLLALIHLNGTKNHPCVLSLEIQCILLGESHLLSTSLCIPLSMRDFSNLRMLNKRILLQSSVSIVKVTVSMNWTSKNAMCAHNDCQFTIINEKPTYLQHMRLVHHRHCYQNGYWHTDTCFHHSHQHSWHWYPCMGLL